MDLNATTLNTIDITTADVATGGAPSEPPLVWLNIVLGIIMYIMAATTFFGNLLVLVAVYNEKSLQTAFNFFIVNLAVTDMGIAATAMTFYATEKMLGYWPFGNAICTLWIFCDYGLTFASVFTLLAISSDRFWSVFWSLSYRSVNKKKKSLIMIVTVWVVMLCLWVPALTVDRLDHIQAPDTCMWDPAQNQEFVVIIAIVGHHGPCITLLVFYFRVFCYLKARVKLRPITKNSRVAPMAQPNSELSFCDGGLDSSMDHAALTAKSSGMNTGSTTVTDEMLKQQTTNNNVHSTSDQAIILSVSTLEPDHKRLPQKLSTQMPRNQNGAATHSNPKDAAATFLQVPDPKEDVSSVASGKRSSTKSAEQKREGRDKRVFITLTYIIAGYLICWVPFHFVFDITSLDTAIVPSAVYDVTFWMTYVNSTINPFLYNFSSPDFRDAFRKIVTNRKRPSRTTSNGNQVTPSV